MLREYMYYNILIEVNSLLINGAVNNLVPFFFKECRGLPDMSSVFNLSFNMQKRVKLDIFKLKLYKFNTLYN